MISQYSQQQGELTFSADQERGLQVFADFIADPLARTLVLKGYAGTGKSTLLQEAVKRLPRNLSVAFTAPTNKATKVLREMAAIAGTPVQHISTIYSLLGLVLKSDGELKAIGRGGGSMAAAFDLICLDECSMVNAALMDYIETDLAETMVKVVFMGDPLQLPPINEDHSRSFDDPEYQIELTEIVRQAAGNPIISLTADIRRRLVEGDYSTPEFETQKDVNGHGVYVLPKTKWETWMRAGFCSEAYKTNGDAFRAVAWRNISVNYYNRRIREALYGEEAVSPFLVGERVLNAAPIQDDEMEEILAPTDSEGIVRAVSTITHPYAKRRGWGDCKVYHLAIGYEEFGLLDAYVLHPDSEREYNRKLNGIAAEAKKDRRLWSTFWEFKDCVHDIRPAHALTSHRSQGSTYDNVFADMADILCNRNREEALKSLYVSCSRARYNLMLLA